MIDYENGASGWSLHPVSFGDQKGMTEEDFLSGIVQMEGPNLSDVVVRLDEIVFEPGIHGERWREIMISARVLGQAPVSITTFVPKGKFPEPKFIVQALHDISISRV